MRASQEDITQGNKLCRRFLELAFGGLPYTEMVKAITEPAMYEKELRNHPKDMKFHYNHS
jgi:hypothetical protein